MGDDEIYSNRPKPRPLERRIIHRTLFDTSSGGEGIRNPGGQFPLTAVMTHQRGKPYYIPPKNELLSYEYIPNTLNPADRAEMQNFLQTHCGQNEWEAFCAMVDLIRFVQIDSLVTGQAIPDFDKFGIRFRTKRDVTQFMRCFQSFCSRMRMMCNRGHTPDELYQIQTLSEAPPRIVFGSRE